MRQEERRRWLIRALLRESPEWGAVALPEEESEQRRLLRALLNVRPPLPASEEFLSVQDAYLREEIRRKGITDVAALSPVRPGLYLWQGDITTLRCDAIVNAANSQLLGCFCPNHGCIDNAIHTYSGVQLRLACAEQMERQGHEEETGTAKLTPAFNLPSCFVLHTVGPIVRGRLTREDERLLASCYRSCLELAEANGLRSVAFCCISTGEFRFPNRRAAEIAVGTVTAYLAQSRSQMEVIFNVFQDQDRDIYQDILGAGGAAARVPCAQ